MLRYITLFCLSPLLAASFSVAEPVSLLFPVPGTILRYRSCPTYACVVSEPVNSFVNGSGQGERREGDGD